MIITGWDINEIFPEAIKLMNMFGGKRPSRNGDTLEIGPVITNYMRPHRRVLFHQTRNANPFFHLFESLWMLAGRDDAQSLNYFINDFGARYSDDGTKIRGSAYGVRWRSWFHHDQLQRVIAALKANPDDRRQVITQWDPVSDVAVIGDSKDVPCNLMCLPYIRHGRLDLTVFCRSNDILFGCYGGNAVHFSFLLEYLAEQIGVKMGSYTQISNSWHVYLDNPLWGKVREYDYLKRPITIPHADGTTSEVFNLNYDLFNWTPLGSNREGWHDVLHAFCDFFASDARKKGRSYQGELDRFRTVADKGEAFTFWRTVAFPMFASWVVWKNTKNRALALAILDEEMKRADSDPHNDWLNAATLWYGKGKWPTP